MSLMLISWAAIIMVVIAIVLAVPLLVILLVSPKTRPVLVSTAKFLGWTLSCLLLVGLCGMFSVRSSHVAIPFADPPQMINIHTTDENDRRLIAEHRRARKRTHRSSHRATECSSRQCRMQPRPHA